MDAHHIEHWASGGETSLENTMLLCTRHHRLVHEGGFRIEQDYQGNWFFRRPDGRAVPACGYRPEDMLDDDVHPSAEVLLTGPENLLSQPPPRGARPQTAAGALPARR